jgi:hypothetical protein
MITSSSIFKVFGVTFFCFISMAAAAQDEADLPGAGFSINIENTLDGLRLTCATGCAFTELTFTLKEGSSQMVDQYGIHVKDRERPADGSVADFLFNVTQTAEGLHFEGLKGTAWTNLTGHCGSNEKCQMRIDEQGIHVSVKE